MHLVKEENKDGGKGRGHGDCKCKLNMIDAEGHMTRIVGESA